MKWVAFIHENAYKVLYPWHKDDETGIIVLFLKFHSRIWIQWNPLNSFHATHIQAECVYKHIAPSGLWSQWTLLCGHFSNKDTFLCII